MSDCEEDAIARERITSRRRDVAVIGLRDRSGRLLLIRTTRLPSWWQPVGGGIDANESNPMETVIRKAAEEIGVDLSRSAIRFVLEAPYDFGVGSVFFFESTYRGEPASLRIDRSQIVEHRWIPLGVAEELPMFPATQRFIDRLLREQTN